MGAWSDKSEILGFFWQNLEKYSKSRKMILGKILRPGKRLLESSEKYLKSGKILKRNPEKYWCDLKKEKKFLT